MVEKKSNQEAQDGLGAEAIDQVPPVLGEFPMPLLWLGRVDAAIAYLRAMPEKKPKPGQPVDKLIGYFGRNRAYIPCYALRHALHLRSSKSRRKDLCFASRQKHQGMSGSPSGSVALPRSPHCITTTASPPGVPVKGSRSNGS